MPMCPADYVCWQKWKLFSDWLKRTNSMLFLCTFSVIKPFLSEKGKMLWANFSEHWAFTSHYPGQTPTIVNGRIRPSWPRAVVLCRITLHGSVLRPYFFVWYTVKHGYLRILGNGCLSSSLMTALHFLRHPAFTTLDDIYYEDRSRS